MDRARAQRLKLPHLGFQFQAQCRIQLELTCQFIEVGFFHEVLLVDHHHAGQVNLCGDFRRLRRSCDFGRVQWLVQLQMQPLLERLIGIELDELPLDQRAAAHYGQIRAELKRQGQIIGNNALWIAAHARSQDWILVTNNVREFKRVEGLKVENGVETTVPA